MHHAAQRNEARDRIVDREVAKLESRQRIRRPFAAAATLNGFEVIDTETGRSLGFERDTIQSANGIAQSLNNALAESPKALTRALRGV